MLKPEYLLKYKNGDTWGTTNYTKWGWDTTDLIKDLYDNGELTYRAIETVEKLTNFKNQYIIRM